MKKCLRNIVLAGVALSMAPSWADRTVTDNIDVPSTYTAKSPYSLTVEAGQTDTYSGVISGNGYLSITGGGTFVPTNPENTFRGNLTIDNGVVRLDSAQALRGDIKNKKICTLYHKGGSKLSTSTLRQFQFNDEGATFNCNFAHSAVADEGYASAPFRFMKSCVLTGSVLCGSASGGAKELMLADDPATKPTVTFENYVSVYNSTLALYPTGTFRMKGPVTASTLFCSRTDAGSQGIVELYNMSNSIQTVDLGYLTVKLAGENVISNATVNFASSEDRYAATGRGELLVCSNQHVRALTSPYTQVEGHISSEVQVDFAFGGLEEYVSGVKIPRISFGGAVNLIKEGEGLEQRFSNTTNTTTGAVVVRGGTLRLYNTTVFPNASELIVERGLLDLVNMNTRRETFASVTNVVVGAAGEIVFSKNDKEPFTNMPSISVTSPGRLSAEEKTSFTVLSSGFVVNGVDQGNGTFTFATHPEVLGEGITVKVKRPTGLLLIFR